ncbi:MAG: thiosulfate oxidation carrier protein SoxY [Gammaproteobacteria bacterium]|nr:thiosulfate oxidation carrier protein SoxY [Gammaproteobacteria bacterium]
MNTTRRSFLKKSATAGAFGVAVSAGLISPRAVLAAWPKAAFEAKDLNAAMTADIGSTNTTESADIKLKAPDIAENGAVVPIEIHSKIAGTESISLYVAENATPLAASFKLSDRTEGFIVTRIKMGKTSDVVVVVQAGGKLYSTKKQVKVTIGGCGG